MNHQFGYRAAQGRSPYFRRTLSAVAIATGLAAALFASGLVPIPGANAQPVTLAQPVQLPTFADVVELVSPAVVSVRVRSEARTINIPGFDDIPEGSPEDRFYFRIPDNQDPVPTTSLGSGFFISADGYIVTNNHVIDDAQSFTIIMQDGTEYDARLIGSDPLTDIALLKIDADQVFTYVQFSETPVRVGDWALAIGSPYSLPGTVTLGIVSGRDRRITESAYDAFLQIDAAVNRGNSGGPSFNLSGEVIGVNTAIFSPSGGNDGIAFAVPAEVAAEVIADLLDDGIVQRGWLGVQIQSIDERLAGLLGRDAAGGVIVGAAFEGQPGASAGIETGDIITELDGTPVPDSSKFARMVGGYDPGAEVTFTLFRDGVEMALEVTLGTRPTEQAIVTQVTPIEPPQEVGLGLRTGITTDGEIVVVGMNPEGTAAAAGLREGDVILVVNDVQIDVFEDLQRAVEAARSAEEETMLFQIRRGDAVYFIGVDTWVND